MHILAGRDRRHIGLSSPEAWSCFFISPVQLACAWKRGTGA
jgi:hypothetical protein